MWKLTSLESSPDLSWIPPWLSFPKFDGFSFPLNPHGYRFPLNPDGFSFPWKSSRFWSPFKSWLLTFPFSPNSLGFLRILSFSVSLKFLTVLVSISCFGIAHLQWLLGLWNAQARSAVSGFPTDSGAGKSTASPREASSAWRIPRSGIWRKIRNELSKSLSEKVLKIGHPMESIFSAAMFRTISEWRTMEN